MSFWTASLSENKGWFNLPTGSIYPVLRYSKELLNNSASSMLDVAFASHTLYHCISDAYQFIMLKIM